MESQSTPKEGTTKPQNEIRIGFNSRVRNIIRYANVLLKESNFRSLHLSAIGGAIGSLVNAVEVLKLANAGLFQINKIGTVSYQTVDKKGEVQAQRLYPKLEVTLTLDEPKERTEGFQDKYDEEQRLKLNEVAQKRREQREGERGGYRDQREGGHRDQREGGYRGNRQGGYRDQREGGHRGQREDGYGDHREGGYGDHREGGFRGRGSFRGRGFRGGRDFGGRGGQRGRGFTRGGQRGRGQYEHGGRGRSSFEGRERKYSDYGRQGGYERRGGEGGRPVRRFNRGRGN